ncbi:MAG: putative glycolipid-binding domain-containing protein, partial [Pseudonocardiaceae bacterium]
MSTPRTREQVAREKATGATGHRPAPHGTRMHAWAGVDRLRLEAARVVLTERGLRATGSLVNAPQEGIQAYSASYSLATDEAGVVQRLSVRTAAVTGEHHVTVTRSEEGNWLVDHGQGAVRTSFGGALDVDLAFSPLFNALPIRRLGLHRGAAQ